MKCLKMVLAALALSVGISAQVDTNSQNFYMYIYFINANHGDEVGAYLAFSSDGTNWQEYKKDTVVIAPKVIKSGVPLMRDPNTYYDSTTGVFHLTWTTGWEQDNIGYATSKDLIHWSEQVMIPVGEKIVGCACCWAPEFFYDDLKDSIMVYWSTDRGTVGKEAFCSMTKDFRYFSTPRVYFAPKTLVDGTSEGYSIIDETILKVADNKYYMFFKDERPSGSLMKQLQNIHFVVGPTPQGPWWKGPWDEASEPISNVGREGPTSIILGDEVRVMFDPFKVVLSTDRVRKVKRADLQKGEPPAASSFTAGEAMKTATGDFLPNHGSISKVPRAKVMQVLYGIPDPTVYPKRYLHPKQEWIYVGEAVDYIPNPADTLPTTDTIVPARVYPRGKQNRGCGTGVGLAILVPLGLRGVSLRRRRRKKRDAK